MKKIIFLEGVLLFFIYFLLSNFSIYEMTTLRLREDILVVRDAGSINDYNSIFLIFCIFSSWYKNYVLENYIGLLFVFHLIFKNIFISFSFSEENGIKKILGNFYNSRILLYLLPILSLILVSNIEYKIPSIFYFLFYMYSIIIVGLELIKKVGFYKGNYYFSYYFIHQIVYILLLFWLYITFSF